MIAANHRVARRLSPALRLKRVLRAELRELEGEEGEREAAAYGASVTEWRSVKVSATGRELRRHSPAPELKLDGERSCASSRASGALGRKWLGSEKHKREHQLHSAAETG